MKMRWLIIFLVLAGAGCANTRELTADESEQITEQLRARTLQYADCWKKYGAKKSGTVEVKYVLAFGGAWESVEVDEEKSSDFTPEMKDCVVQTIRGIDLGVKPRTKVFGTYSVRFGK